MKFQTPWQPWWLGKRTSRRTSLTSVSSYRNIRPSKPLSWRSFVFSGLVPQFHWCWVPIFQFHQWGLLQIGGFQPHMPPYFVAHSSPSSEGIPLTGSSTLSSLTRAPPPPLHNIASAQFPGAQIPSFQHSPFSGPPISSLPYLTSQAPYGSPSIMSPISPLFTTYHHQPPFTSSASSTLKPLRLDLPRFIGDDPFG